MPHGSPWAVWLPFPVNYLLMAPPPLRGLPVQACCAVPSVSSEEETASDSQQTYLVSDLSGEDGRIGEKGDGIYQACPMSWTLGWLFDMA